jgi:hypothetical protein
MDWSQALYIGALALAIWTGKPGRLICGVMLANLAVTMTMWREPLTVGLFDLVCAVILIGKDRRANIVAGCFALMQPVYVASWFWQFPLPATYAIVDLLAFVQLAAIGRWDRGMGIGLRAARRLASGRGRDPVYSLAVRGNPYDDLARDRQAIGRGPKGQVGVDDGQW